MVAPSEKTYEKYAWILLLHSAFFLDNHLTFLLIHQGFSGI